MFTGMQTSEEEQLDTVKASEHLLLHTYYNVKLPAILPAIEPGLLAQPAVLDDFEPSHIYSDGDCLYHALSRGLYGVESHHLHLRLLTAFKMSENSTYYDLTSPTCKEMLGDGRRLLANYKYSELMTQVYNSGHYQKL